MIVPAPEAKAAELADVAESFYIPATAGRDMDLQPVPVMLQLVRPAWCALSWALVWLWDGATPGCSAE